MPTPRLKILQRVLMFVLAVLILRVTFSVVLGYRNYFPPDFSSDFLRGRQVYFYGAYSAAFYAHILAGPITLVLGLVLVSERFRQRHPALHRSLGKVQAVLVLFLLAPSGLWMSRYSDTGTIAAISFASLSMATGTCVLLGWNAAVTRRFPEHRRWMMRCFVLLCSAVVLRLLGGLATVTGADYTWSYPLAAWLSWLLPLIILEVLSATNRYFVTRRDVYEKSIGIGHRSDATPSCGACCAMTIRRLHLRIMSVDRQRRTDRCESDRCGRVAFTLVELVVVLLIVIVLLAILFPATRTSREAARRNQCLNNVKQLAIGLQNHHNTRTTLPLASTAPLVEADGSPKYGQVSNASPNADSPTNWTAGQHGDGYSWIAQILPFMEDAALYEKMTSAQSAPVVRHGKLADAAFASSSNLNWQASGTIANPYFWSVKFPEFVCPSFPGEEDVAAFGAIPNSRVATGNYVALAATHFRSTPSDHLESAPLGKASGDPSGKDCLSGPYCGNGGLPFPGIVDGKVQKTGRAFGEFPNGTTRTVIIAESREKVLTSWYSGLASYVVAIMPPPNGTEPRARFVSGLNIWSCSDVPNCVTALNRGRSKGDSSPFYQPTSPHGGGPRIWGPSSRHANVIIHGFADAHVEAIHDAVDTDVYMQLVDRSGNQIEAP